MEKKSSFSKALSCPLQPAASEKKGTVTGSDGAEVDKGQEEGIRKKGDLLKK